MAAVTAPAYLHLARVAASTRRLRADDSPGLLALIDAGLVANRSGWLSLTPQGEAVCRERGLEVYRPTTPVVALVPRLTAAAAALTPLERDYLLRIATLHPAPFSWRGQHDRETRAALLDYGAITYAGGGSARLTADGIRLARSLGATIDAPVVAPRRALDIVALLTGLPQTSARLARLACASRAAVAKALAKAERAGRARRQSVFGWVRAPSTAR